MKKVLFLLVISIFILCSGNIFAQELALQAGGWEVGVDGFYDFEGPGGKTAEISGRLGHFVMNDLEVGGFIGYDYAEQRDAKDIYGIEIGAFVEYNFERGWMFIPYVGASLFWKKVKTDTIDKHGFALEGKVGAKYFMTENWAIDGSFHIALAHNDIFPSDGELDDMDFGLTIGIRAYY